MDLNSLGHLLAIQPILLITGLRKFLLNSPLQSCLPPKAGTPSLQDLKPGDLRWTWCNNNRNKMHSKCPAPEPSCSHPSPPGLGKNFLPQNWSLAPKRLGTTVLKYSSEGLGMFGKESSCPFSPQE